MPDLPSFADLRLAAETRSVMRASIELVKYKVRALDWDISGPERRAAIAFFHRPDPDYFSFDSWLEHLLEQVLVLDSLVLYMPRNGGVQLMDGSLFEPAIGPAGEAAGYHQYLYGPVPRRSMAEIMASPTPSPVITWAEDDARMACFQHWSRPWTPFGFPPVEKALSEPDEKVPLAFGITPRDLGIDTDGDADPMWLKSLLQWLADVFSSVAGGGHIWKWRLD